MADSVQVDGAKIEHLRKYRAGLSRKRAAEILGLSPAGLYIIERHNKTRPATLKRIAALLGAGPESLERHEVSEATRESA